LIYEIGPYWCRSVPFEAIEASGLGIQNVTD